MSDRNVLVTGGYGCIGSETAKWILRQTDAHVLIASRKVSEERSERVFHDVDHERLKFVELDVTQRNALERLFAEHPISHVVHMAALQTPDCNAHRDLGLQINLAGTQNLIEVMKTSPRPLQRFVFASSIAVYGPRAAYPDSRVPMLAEPKPVNVYGAWKLAGENISRFYCEDTGVPTISVRPGVLFGPGRDAGLTASPTTAMKSLALGLAYEIPFQSRQDYLYAPDVGGAIGNATLEPFAGYGTFTLPSHTLRTEQIVEIMKRVATELGIESQFQITIGKERVPFICDLDYSPFLEAFPQSPHTDPDQAIKNSMQVFLDQVERGWLTTKNYDLA